MVGHEQQLTGHSVGYVRVSAADQNEARQVEALTAAGVPIERIYVDKASGKSTDRQQLTQLLNYVRDGDTVHVKSPDRLARSTQDLLHLIQTLKAKGVSVRFVDNAALNTDTPQGEFMLTILAAVAQLERETIRERQAEGIAIAKRKGVYERAAKLSPEDIAEARKRVAEGVAKSHIARELGVSRQTLYSALSGTGKYADS